MLPRVLALASCWAIGAVCGVWSAVLLGRMVDELNTELPEGRKISPYWWHWWKYRHALREYRRLRPAGRLDRQLRNLSYALALCAGGAAIAIGLGVELALYLAGGGLLIMWLTHRPSTSA
jgi:hypothetical protein